MLSSLSPRLFPVVYHLPPVCKKMKRTLPSCCYCICSVFRVDLFLKHPQTDGQRRYFRQMKGSAAMKRYLFPSYAISLVPRATIAIVVLVAMLAIGAFQV